MVLRQVRETGDDQVKSILGSFSDLRSLTRSFSSTAGYTTYFSSTIQTAGNKVQDNFSSMWLSFYSLVSSCWLRIFFPRKKEWLDSEKLRNDFNQNPLQVMHQLLHQIRHHPGLAKEIFQELARNIRLYPHLYLPYDSAQVKNWKKNSSQKNLRFQAILQFQDLFWRIMLTPSQQKTSEKITEGSVTGPESMALTDRWNSMPPESLTVELREFKLACMELQKAKQNIQELWQNCDTFLSENLPFFESDNCCENVEDQNDGTLSFGGWIERLFFKGQSVSLHSDEIKQNCVDTLNDLLLRLKEEKNLAILKEFPKVFAFIKELQFLLSDPEHLEIIREIFETFLVTAAPLKKRSSPSLRS